MPHHAVAHAAAGGEFHFLVLQVIAGIGEQRDVAGMVVMHVGDDNVADLAGLESERSDAFGDRPHDLPVALLCHGLAETGVDDDPALRVRDDPYVIIQWHLGVVRVAADEVFRRTAHEPRIFDRMDLINILFHCRALLVVRSRLISSRSDRTLRMFPLLPGRRLRQPGCRNRWRPAIALHGFPPASRRYAARRRCASSARAAGSARTAWPGSACCVFFSAIPGVPISRPSSIPW